MRYPKPETVQSVLEGLQLELLLGSKRRRPDGSDALVAGPGIHRRS
jgi:hypothetical protein